MGLEPGDEPTEESNDDFTPVIESSGDLLLPDEDDAMDLEQEVGAKPPVARCHCSRAWNYNTRSRPGRTPNTSV